MHLEACKKELKGQYRNIFTKSPENGFVAYRSGFVIDFQTNCRKCLKMDYKPDYIY